jgi:hypothetical protein
MQGHVRAEFSRALSEHPLLTRIGEPTREQQVRPHACRLGRALQRHVHRMGMSLGVKAEPARHQHEHISVGDLQPGAEPSP